jgi:hypothetical protein
VIVKDAYFRLRLEGEFVRCLTGLIDDGEYIDTFKPEWLVRKHRDVVATIPAGERRFPVPDYLWTMPHYCLSQRAYEALRRANLNLSPQLEWVPVRVIWKSGKDVGRYWWPKCGAHSAYDVFDYEHSKYTVYKTSRNDPKLVDKVSEWVLRADKIGALDYFYGCRVYWFASPRVKQVVEENGLLGFSFEPVSLST